MLNFLYDFVRDLGANVEPGDREHVDYVPTQVVTEWFRSAFKYEGSRIDGIYYPSAARRGGMSIVLFADRNDLRLTDDKIENLAKADSVEKWWLKARQVISPQRSKSLSAPASQRSAGCGASQIANSRCR
jgi:hypothetical protein